MMREDVIVIFESALSDPGSFKSGEYLETHILTKAKRIFQRDRAGLIEP